ncbi:Uncharacterised protein [uncultured archaeon]|nr:Uncharacterised protein [uncultured archaeon]
MITLVKCLVYPKTDLGKQGEKPRYLTISDFFPDPILKDEFRINSKSEEVLNQTLPNYFLEGYLGIEPWIVNISKDRGYLDISEIDGKKADGTIADLLSRESFSVAKRNYRLTDEQKNGLVESIMGGLASDNIFGIFVSRNDTRLSSRVYSDVLKALGRNVSSEQIEQMFLAQYQGLEAYERAEFQRQAEDWSSLANQVVGAEVL